MNVVLWIIQAALAVLYLLGGAYKTFAFDQIARELNMLSHGAWRAFGVVEMVGALLLVLPAVARRMSWLTSYAAMALAVETFVLAVVYARHSLVVSASNPLIWSLVMGVLVAAIAYGRYSHNAHARGVVLS